MANNSLYALATEYSDLYRALTETIDEDGIVDADVFAAVEQAKGTFEEKRLRSQRCGACLVMTFYR